MRFTYDDVSPFTGNRCVLVEWDETKHDHVRMCMETGYHTYDKSWTVGSDIIQIVEGVFPDVVLQTKKTHAGNYWYKIILMTPFGALMPEVEDGENVWALYSLRDADPSVDVVVMEVPLSDEVVKYRSLDEGTRQIFPEKDFSLAMDMFQAIGAAVYGGMSEVVKDN